MIPDYEDSEISDAETNRVMRALAALIVSAAIAFAIVMCLLMFGCAPVKPPPQLDAGRCTVVVVQGFDAGARDPDWGY